MTKSSQVTTHPIFQSALAVLYSLFTAGVNASAQTSSTQPWPEGCVEGSLGTQGQSDFQLTLICMPSGTSWNGNLLLYSHGFVNPQDPLKLPSDEVNQVSVNGQSLVKSVLSLGYAFATTSYSKNGWAVEQASTNLNTLLSHVKSNAPQPINKVLLIGGSEGGLVVALQLEKYAELYNGGLALCGAIGGAPYQVKYIGDFRAVFDYFFPDIFNFGIIDIPSDATNTWENTYTPEIATALTHQTLSDQLFKVTQAAQDSAELLNSRITTAEAVLGYNIFETDDLIKSSGGNPYDNSLTSYSGSNDDTALNAGVERVSASTKAKDYLIQNYQTSGDLNRPLVTLHNTQDPKVPFQHETIYASLVRSKNHQTNLTSIPIPGYGHCNFTVEEILSALSLLIVRTTS